MNRKTTIYRSLAFALLLGGLFAALGASDCARVGSSVTAPEDSEFLPSAGRDPCVQDCRDVGMERYEQELRRHRDAMRECDRNDDPECAEEEEERHELALREIIDDFKECKENCHEQGGGDGGE